MVEKTVLVSDDIKRAAAALRKLRPAYETLINFYEQVFKAQEASKNQIYIAPIQISDEMLSLKTEENFPLIDIADFAVDIKSANKLFIELCESLVERQGPEGLWMDFMPNHKADGSFHPRFNLWYAESLIEGYELTGDRSYLEAAAQTARMFVRVQKGDGTIYYKNYLDGRSNQNSVCGSAVAFAGIIWL